MIRGLVIVAFVVFGVAAPNPASNAQSACEEVAVVDLITAASRSDVRGVVEYEVIAENSASFGKSVAATRRIWGDVVADRWVVTASESNCPTTPTAQLGERWYLIVGFNSSEGPMFGTPSGESISDLEAGALASLIAAPVAVESGSVDHTMAWLRVNWWSVVGVIALGVIVVAVISRRRSGARQDYLF